jgi:hypothetical protein
MVGKEKDKKEGTKLVFSIKLNVNHISCSVKCGVLLLLFLLIVVRTWFGSKVWQT